MERLEDKYERRGCLKVVARVIYLLDAKNIRRVGVAAQPKRATGPEALVRF